VLVMAENEEENPDLYRNSASIYIVGEIFQQAKSIHNMLQKQCICVVGEILQLANQVHSQHVTETVHLCCVGEILQLAKSIHNMLALHCYTTFRLQLRNTCLAENLIKWHTETSQHC
jgi:hypothetical protein